MKEFADDNFKFDKNGRKLSKQVENTVGKGEIARYEQFLLFLQCFQKACFPRASKGVIVWEWVNAKLSGITENITTSLKTEKKKHWGEKEKCWTISISPFPTMFSKACSLIITTQNFV